MKLTKWQIELIQHALKAHRDAVRWQQRIALDETTDCARRDLDRYDKIITESLKLDDILGDELGKL